jgi:hypothetical protein
MQILFVAVAMIWGGSLLGIVLLLVLQLHKSRDPSSSGDHENETPEP